MEKITPKPMVEESVVKLKRLSRKTADMIKQSRVLLNKLTITALGPEMAKLKKSDKDKIYLGIGITTIRLIQMRSILLTQKRCIANVRINEFLMTPFIAIKKIVNIFSSS